MRKEYAEDPLYESWLEAPLCSLCYNCQNQGHPPSRAVSRFAASIRTVHALSCSESPKSGTLSKEQGSLGQLHGKKLVPGDCMCSLVKHSRGANLARPTPSSLLTIFLLDKLVGILVREAGSKLALLRRTLASPGIGLGRLGSLLRLVILAILSGAGVAVGGSCTIMDLAVGLRDDLASFVLESVRIDDAVDLSGAVWYVLCQSVNSNRAVRDT